MSSISVFAGFIATIHGIYVEAPLAYNAVCFLVFIIFIGNILVALFSTTFISKMFYALVTPIWYCAGIILFGGGFGEGAAIVTNLSFVYIFFRKSKYLYPLFFYGVSIVVLSYLFTGFFGTISEPYNQEFDNLLTILTSIIWLLLIFNIYKNEKEILIDDLKLKNDELENTTEELEQFTYIASHDLKTPIRNVVSFLDLIEKNIKNENFESVLADLDFARNASKQMYSLVTGILELTTVTNKLKEGRKPNNLSAIAEEVKSVLHNQYKNAVIESNGLHKYSCNENEMYIVFQNLIENGLKYNSNEIPKVEVSSKVDGSYTYLYFKDNGIGIDEEYHNQIFEYFKRLHSIGEYEGTGLGLGLCKKIIDSYNGSIKIESSKEKGSLFIIKLPNSNNSV